MKFPNYIRAVQCLLFFVFLSVSHGYSQCANGATASTLSYDSSFTGGGNNVYDANFPQFDTNRVYLNFPQFDPSKGTLTKVDVLARITVKNGYQIENKENQPTTPNVKILRTDIINSAAFMQPFENVKSKTIASNLGLGASDGVTGSGPDYKEAGPIYSYNNYLIINTITTNLANFMGNGQILFNYETHTDLYATGSNSIFNSSTEDSVYFQLVYHYCLTSLLPAEINNFNATKIASGKTIQLTWSAPNETAGDKFYLQKSTDGENFSSFETVTAKPGTADNYRVVYTTRGDDRDKVFFRIRQTEADGTLKYSTVKSVTLDYASTTMKIFPTITRDNVNIYFPYTGKGDYKVRIFSMTGQVMQQSEYIKTNRIKMNLTSSLKPGLYVVSVVNKQSLETQQTKILIQ